MLLARRLIESVAKFVEVRQGGWDVHKNTVPATKRLSEEFATPVADLKARGLLDSTLGIAMGEFGRNPSHISRARATGGTVEKRPVSPGDIQATVCEALGIDYTNDWTTGSGRPVPVVARGAAPVAELFG